MKTLDEIIQLIHLTKQVFSKTCVCGHMESWHHMNSIATEECRKVQGPVLLGECELDPICDCNYYIDQEDPLKEEKLAAVAYIYDIRTSKVS